MNITTDFAQHGSTYPICDSQEHIKGISHPNLPSLESHYVLTCLERHPWNYSSWNYNLYLRVLDPIHPFWESCSIHSIHSIHLSLPSFHWWFKSISESQSRHSQPYRSFSISSSFIHGHNGPTQITFTLARSGSGNIFNILTVFIYRVYRDVPTTPSTHWRRTSHLPYQNVYFCLLRLKDSIHSE
jgi:hypothetical protein